MIFKGNDFLKLSNDNYEELLLIFLRSIKKTESFGSLFGVFFMMHVVCMHDSFHVFALGFEFYFDSSVDDYVVENKVK